MEGQELEDDFIRDFFDYWDNLTFFIRISPEQRKLVDQEIRAAVIDILAIGMDDPNFKKKRHVLSASELLPLVEERIGSPVKKSNLYFHLNKLEEAELITEVKQKSYGKINISYYGRTARAFTQDMYKKNPSIEEILESDEFINLLQELNPDMSHKKIQEKMNTTLDLYYKNFDEDRMSSWLATYQQNVLAMDLDIRKLFELFEILRRYDKEVIDGMYEISKLLKFPDHKGNPMKFE